MECRRSSIFFFYFISLHPVDLFCIQESNIGSFSFFPIHGYSALQYDCPHSRSGILSLDDPHASGGVTVFVKQCQSFSELSTSSLSLLEPYSDNVGVNISLIKSFSLSFLTSVLLLFALLQWIAEPTPFPLDSSFLQKYHPSWGFNYHYLLWDLKCTCDLFGEEVFHWIISSDFLPLYDSDIHTSGSRSFPDIFLASSSLAFKKCFWIWGLITYQFN